MVDQFLSRSAIKPIQVLIGKSAQQQLSLVQPTSVRRRIEHTEARMRREVRSGMVVDMRRAIIHNQMNALGQAVTPVHLPDAPQEMLVVVLVQTATPHLAGEDIERDQEVGGAVTLIFELTPPGSGPRAWAAWAHTAT